jgi:GH15 family glucan-1,4-alpha-glucosidase
VWNAADLAERSREMIRRHQAPTGAYPACPTFPPYRYCWLRDGSFIADAMSRCGEIESAEAFFDWVARLEGFAARYALDGGRADAAWPLRQHDGWGLWLWALRAHCRRHGRSPARWCGAVTATREHLARVRLEPCTDWWEEREGVHAVTLACVAAGLDEDLDLEPAESRLDASLLVLPLLGFALPRPVDELISPGGGVHRHLEDTYYGGGEWPVLTALLGLADGDRAAECLAWIVARASPEGFLPEQSDEHLLVPEMLAPWVAKWGPSASPLLWSHAMFLTLFVATVTA